MLYASSATVGSKKTFKRDSDLLECCKRYNHVVRKQSEQSDWRRHIAQSGKQAPLYVSCCTPTGGCITRSLSVVSKWTGRSLFKRLLPWKSFPRIEHITEASECPTPAFAKESLYFFTALVDLLREGTVLTKFRQYFWSARLIASWKPEGVARSNPVSEMLQNIWAKFLSRHSTPKSLEELLAKHISVEIEIYCEVPFHAAKEPIKKTCRYGLYSQWPAMFATKSPSPFWLNSA